MPASKHKDFSNLIVTHGDHRGRQLDPPRPATARSVTYGRHNITVDVTVLAVSDTHLCIQQHDPAWGDWLAWVPKSHVTPR